MKKSVLSIIPALFLSIILSSHKNLECSNTTTLANKKTTNKIPVINMPDDQNDGPYVQYKNDQVLAKYIIQANGQKIVRTDSVAASQKNSLSLKVGTDVPGEFFQVQLKQQLQDEKSEYKKVDKLFVLSDIEGNFTAFKKLLQGNGVIDSNYNWSFGKGHLVLVGDFFDRGEMVTEVLWLIYSLEEKAKAAGGYVHYILGNHEIMNLSGDLRYVRPKYLNNATILNEKYESMFNESTELGRWLRTKNVVEKINNIVFTHGGISADMNRMELDIADINKMARPFYADSTYKYPNSQTEIIYSDLGPFWYRGYYTGNDKITSSQIDSSLSLFNIRHIVTGHTIVADTISVWYGGRILNTDVHHAEGKSEALFIEDNKYYRVNADGKKMLLL